MLRLLGKKPQSVGEIANEFPISRPAVSRHLALLEKAGLVRHEAIGNRNVYALDPQGFEVTRAWLDGFWSEAETRLRLLAENLPEAGDE